MNSILELFDWWQAGNLYPLELIQEMRDMISEKCAKYGIDLGANFYIDMIKNDPRFVEDIIKETKECELLTQVDKEANNYETIESFIKSTKDELNTLKKLDNHEKRIEKLNIITSELEKTTDDCYQGYKLESQALLYLEKLYNSKIDFIESIKADYESLETYKEALKNLSASE